MRVKRIWTSFELWSNKLFVKWIIRINPLMILFMFLILGLKLTVKTWFIYGWLTDENWSLTTHIDSLVQHCIISIVLATGMLQSWTELCIWADANAYRVVLSKNTWCFVLYLKKKIFRSETIQISVSTPTGWLMWYLLCLLVFLLLLLSLTWESPYLGKTVFILRRGPGSLVLPCSMSSLYRFIHTN